MKKITQFIEGREMSEQKNYRKIFETAAVVLAVGGLATWSVDFVRDFSELPEWLDKVSFALPASKLAFSVGALSMFALKMVDDLKKDKASTEKLGVLGVIFVATAALQGAEGLNALANGVSILESIPPEVSILSLDR